MKKSDFYGIKEVFRFEYLNAMRTGSARVYLIILCIISFLALPGLLLVQHFTGDEEETHQSSVTDMWVYDETGFGIDYDMLTENEALADLNVTVLPHQDAYDAMSQILENEENLTAVLLKVTYDEADGFMADLVTAESTSLTEDDLDSFEDAFGSFLKEQASEKINVADDLPGNQSEASADESVDPAVDEDSDAEDDRITADGSNYYTLLAGMMFVFMLISMTAGQIATSVATEKSSKVIEYLLISTRPIAMLSGKILAMILVCLTNLFAALSSAFVSLIVVNIVITISGHEGAGQTADEAITALAGVPLASAIIAALSAILGVMFFCVIAALAGASVSKLDELPDALRTYNGVMLAAFFIDYFLIIKMQISGVSEGLMTLCGVFPLTSGMILPGLILSGDMGLLAGTVSVILLAVTVCIVFIMAGAVYEGMILYQGRRLMFRDIWNIAFEGRKRA